jgi:hypothetical protein
MIYEFDSYLEKAGSVQFVSFIVIVPESILEQLPKQSRIRVDGFLNYNFKFDLKCFL